MNIFDIRKDIIDDYKNYISSFINIKDERIREAVGQEMQKGILCPAPLVQFNPNFETGAPLSELCDGGFLHPIINDIFRGYTLYTHQVEALRFGVASKNFVVTSGTGSGKSLTYIGTIFDQILKQSDSRNGIKAIIVYPMNALINSQTAEFEGYRGGYEDLKGVDFPISFGQYTGQESAEVKEKMRLDPPDILLTNYMMLELIMTRGKEASLRKSFKESLNTLVFDELHTYRGRQGSDISMLIRRVKAYCTNDIQCIGTSATMSSGEGTLQSQKQEVADVASLIFGERFDQDQIIGETLTRVTISDGSLPSQNDLSGATKHPISNQADELTLGADPLAVWLEHKIGLKEKDGRLVKGMPRTLQSIIEELSVDSGEGIDTCEAAIKQLLTVSDRINTQLKSVGKRKSYFPFRLHQFISQTGSVFLTLEPRKDRRISLRPGYYLNEHDGEKKIFPTVFSRVSGYEYICLRKDVHSQRLYPRFFTDLYDGADAAQSGYLILQDPEEEEIWSDDMIEILPDAWYRVNKGGVRKVDKKYAHRIPTEIYFDAAGHYDDVPFDGGAKGWFMPTPLLFDPTCGLFYDSKSRESAKLMQLGNEGRSTATTTLALASVNALRKAKLPPKDQKLLSFTDNRQDASLQAGHYNDFINVGFIRAAIYKALMSAPNQRLTIDHLPEYVFKALGLDQSYFAVRPQDNFRTKRENEDTFKDYLLIRILQDLKRGWRYTMPNLEQCALLNISYKYLDEIVGDKEWIDFTYFKDWNSEEKLSFIIDTLDFLRTSKAISHRFLSTESRVVEARINEKLKSEWRFDGRIDGTAYARYQSVGRIKNARSISVGKTSNWGKYVSARLTPGDERLSRDDFDAFATAFFELLTKFDLVSSLDLKGEKGAIIQGYAVNADMIEWVLGDGSTVRHDRVRLRSYRDDVVIRANEYFKDFYVNKAISLGQSIGREHTGQIANHLRQEREQAFREGKISTLFCSPTMELGVDISNLNIVHLRNVPPNPANYAQRSGRAGRSGQGALVITYCSQFSPHDRNYFEKKTEMVDGVVRPPKISLDNIELIEAHIHAMYLLEAQLPLSSSVMEILEVTQEGQPLKPEILAKMEDTMPHIKSGLLLQIEKMLKEDELLRSIYSIQRATRTIDDIRATFDGAFKRWRSSYQNALSTKKRAQEIIDNPVIVKTSDEAKSARKTRAFCERQLELLTNNLSHNFNSTFSEFYPFRYLAAEGFLPGYNFTKLPIRLVLNTGSDVAYLSRPRLIALQEFGPRNVIYHNGSTYEVKKIQIDDVPGKKERAKIATTSGYIFLEGEYNTEVCPITDQPIGKNGNSTYLNDLLPMTESIAEIRHKINCEEEERMRLGYDVSTYFSLPKGQKAYETIGVKEDGEALLNILYMPTARIVQINKKWKRSERDHFIISKKSAYWKKESDVKNDEEQVIVNARLYTDYIADALYVQPTSLLNIDEDAIITLNYALKRAIEEIYQVENNEMATTLMGGDESRNIFIYESAEGSLGILSQIADENVAFTKIVEKAYDICHFKDGRDVRPEIGKASYDDLLSYYNQRDHERIDRYSIQIVLERLMACTVEHSKNNLYDDYEDQYQQLLKQHDQTSSTELKFLKYLYEKGLRLPDKAQPMLSERYGLYIRPDFQYDDHVFIFCDGTPHDNEEVKRKDRKQRRALRDKGATVITWYYMDDIDKLISDYSHLFIKVKDQG